MPRNKEAIEELALFIERCPHAFDMDSTRVDTTPDPLHSQCGTAGCIAGHAALLWPECRYGDEITQDGYLFCTFDHEAVISRLGITPRAFYSLCYPYEEKDGVETTDIAKNKAWAVRCLRRLARTGRVAWKGTREA